MPPRSPRRAFLAVDLQVTSQEVNHATSRRPYRRRVGVTYVIAAGKVAKDPVLRVSVLAGLIPLLDAARQVLKPRATDLLQSMVTASASERAQAMRHFREEALEVIDAETAPSKGNGRAASI